jgi:hypothetical protein
MLEIKTIAVDQRFQASLRGEAVTVYRVRYTVGEHGPFYADFLPADFTPAKIKAEQERMAATLSAI